MTAPAIKSGGRGALTPEFSTRAGLPEDLSFVYATWLRSYRHSSAFAKKITDRVFYLAHHAAIERILARGATVLVCTPADSPEVILGYAVTEGTTLHFVYVKKPFRRLGIASGLLAGEGPSMFSHWTDDWDRIRDLWPHAEYNPYLI